MKPTLHQLRLLLEITQNKIVMLLVDFATKPRLRQLWHLTQRMKRIERAIARKEART